VSASDEGEATKGDVTVTFAVDVASAVPAALNWIVTAPVVALAQVEEVALTV
jgi:hypothetical protein